MDMRKFQIKNEDKIQLPSSGSVREKVRKLEMGNPVLTLSGGIELGEETNKANNSIQTLNLIGNQMTSVGTLMSLTNRSKEQVDFDRIEGAGGKNFSDGSSVSPKLWERTNELIEFKHILKSTDIRTDHHPK